MIVPAISIIIPVYNKCKYLDNLWNALINQSFYDFECIIIDDGSTDGSGKKCDEMANGDARFRVIHTSNGGVSRARNIALDCACGEYITFIDADDSFHVDYLQNLYDSIIAYDSDMVISSCLKVWDNSDRKVPINIPFTGLKQKQEFMPRFVKDQLLTGIYGYCWCKILRKRLIGANRFNEEIRLAEDLDFYLELYPKITSIYFDDHQYYYYLQVAENSSMLKNDWEYDYYVQLKIQLKLYNTVKEMGFLSGENRMLSVRRIWDYVFFSIYYAPIDNIKTICNKIRLLQFGERCSLFKRPLRQIIILVLYLLRCDSLLVCLLKLFRRIKKVSY